MVDELIARTKMPASEIMANLSLEELKRVVRRMPGHLFVKV